LIYSHFRIGNGSKFFIYNEERTMVLGAYTPEVSNNQDNEFATDLVQGSTTIRCEPSRAVAPLLKAISTEMLEIKVASTVCRPDTKNVKQSSYFGVHIIIFCHVSIFTYICDVKK
jgi:hypothetical protein